MIDNFWTPFRVFYSYITNSINRSNSSISLRFNSHLCFRTAIILSNHLHFSLMCQLALTCCPTVCPAVQTANHQVHHQRDRVPDSSQIPYHRLSSTCLRRIIPIMISNLILCCKSSNYLRNFQIFRSNS